MAKKKKASGRTEQLAGLEFRVTREGWQAQRPFRFLPVEEGLSGQRTTDALADIEIILEDADRPSAAQQRALQGFLDNEESMCSSLLDATHRWIQHEQRVNPDWFEGEAPIDSLEDLRRVIDFRSLLVLPREHGGMALIGFSFGCDWDMEHGLGMAMHNGTVIAIGSAEMAFDPETGLADEVCTPQERSARDSILADEP